MTKNISIKILGVTSILGLVLASTACSGAPQEQEPLTEPQTSASQGLEQSSPNPQPAKTGTGAPADGSTPTPNGPPKNPGEGGPAPCIAGVLGDGKTCTSDTAFKALAQKKCVDHPQLNVSYANDCANGSRVAKFTCCK